MSLINMYSRLQKRLIKENKPKKKKNTKKFRKKPGRNAAAEHDETVQMIKMNTSLFIYCLAADTLCYI